MSACDPNRTPKTRRFWIACKPETHLFSTDTRSMAPSGLASGLTHMHKFLRIGVHQSNVSGYTSKAWWVRRVGSTVFLKWGAVEVDGVGDGRKIYWTPPPRAKTIRCSTVQRAKDYAKMKRPLANAGRRHPRFLIG